jgi:hypothetical protein
VAEPVLSRPRRTAAPAKVVLVIQRGGELLCREAKKFKVPEVGEAMTLVDEGDEAAVAGQVALVVPGPKDLPYVYGGAWGQEVDDAELDRLGFRPCRKAELEVLEEAVG